MQTIKILGKTANSRTSKTKHQNDSYLLLLEKKKVLKFHMNNFSYIIIPPTFKRRPQTIF